MQLLDSLVSARSWFMSVCRGRHARLAFRAMALMMLAPDAARAADPWADQVVSYSAGTSADPNYTAAPGVTLGSPERFSGENTPFGPFPGVVSMFSPAWGVDEIISIGEGGHLTVKFNEPVNDDPANPFGIDLLVFGNSFFAADFSSFPDASHLSSATLFDADAALIEVSTDGINFFSVAPLADRLFPTQGYLDSLAFDAVPGLLPTNFTRPVNPALTLADFDGLTRAQAVGLYGGSGGGTGIDLAAVGLSSIQYVRISVPDDGNSLTRRKAEIDAFATVPEPGTLLLAAAAMMASSRRRIRTN